MGTLARGPPALAKPAGPPAKAATVAAEARAKAVALAKAKAVQSPPKAEEVIGKIQQPHKVTGNEDWRAWCGEDCTGSTSHEPSLKGAGKHFASGRKGGGQGSRHGIAEACGGKTQPSSGGPEPEEDQRVRGPALPRTPRSPAAITPPELLQAPRTPDLPPAPQAPTADDAKDTKQNVEEAEAVHANMPPSSSAPSGPMDAGQKPDARRVLKRRRRSRSRSRSHHRRRRRR